MLRQNPVVEFVDVGDARIAYIRVGNGPPLVLLHGAPSDSRTWQWALPELSQDFTVIAWDAPGYGASSGVPESWRLPEYADALAGFLDALGVEHPHVGGHSFGSCLAICLFHRHPSVPRSLVLVGGYAGWGGSLPPEEVARRVRSFLAMADHAAEIDPTAIPGRISDLMSADRATALAQIIRDNMRPASLRALAHSVAADLRPMLSSIDVPTLLLHGEADARSPLEAGQALHAAIPNSELVPLPRLGHECCVEAPEVCAAEIRRFLKSP